MEENTHRSLYFDSLPADVAANIIDRLGWQDAAKTCLLSDGLHNAWKTCFLYKKNLNFKENRKLSRSKFVELVNHILHAYEGSNADSLSIVFDPYISESATKIANSFENWVLFARTKCVCSLQIDLFGLIRKHGFRRPQFPVLQDWDKLISLSLNLVELDDAELETGLKRHLVNLESLSLQNASRLKRVVVASLKLNKLKISDCSDVCRIDITSAPNLRCFKYRDKRYRAQVHGDPVPAVILRFQHVPKLSHVSLGPGIASHDSLSELQKVGMMLEKLKIQGDYFCTFSPELAVFKAWDRLTSLSLKSVQLYDEDFEHGLMRNLGNLESLFIEWPGNLTQVVVDSAKLKKLVIITFSLSSINIDYAPNLQYFECRSDVLEGVEFKHVPKLSHVSLYKVVAWPDILSKLETVESLEKLEFEITPRPKNSPDFPLLRNLKELQCHFRMSNESSIMLVIFTVILDACPKLQKLTLGYHRHLGYSEGDEWFHLTKDRLLDRSRVHHCLEEVEFWRSSQHENEVEAVKYLKEIATNLKRFTYAEPSPVKKQL